MCISLCFSNNCIVVFVSEDKLKTWTTVYSPYPVLTVLLMYLAVVKLGPSIMKSRRPIELHNTMRIYNLFQVLSNLFFVLRVRYFK